MPRSVGASKPAPELYAAVLGELGIAADRAAAVGDEWERDVLGARNAGLRAVWLHAEAGRPLLPGVARAASWSGVEAALRELGFPPTDALAPHRCPK